MCEDSPGEESTGVVCEDSPGEESTGVVCEDSPGEESTGVVCEDSPGGKSPGEDLNICFNNIYWIVIIIIWAGIAASQEVLSACKPLGVYVYV